MSEENAVASEVVEISATYKKGEEGDREVTILFDFGGDLTKAAEKFGADVVYSNFVRAAKVTAQSAMRRLMEQGKADDEVQSTMEAWKPGVALERTVDPTAALLRTFPSLSPEAQAKLIADLTAKAAKAA